MIRSTLVHISFLRLFLRETRENTETGHTWCWVDLNADSRTDTTSVFVVKWLMPSSPLSCWRPMIMAAPAMNPTIAACERKPTRNPNLRDSMSSNEVLTCWTWKQVEEVRQKSLSRKKVPKQSKDRLECSSKESHRENEASVSSWVGQWILYILNHRGKQEWYDSNRSNGNLPGAPHQSIDERRDYTRVWIHCSKNEHSHSNYARKLKLKKWEQVITRKLT